MLHLCSEPTPIGLRILYLLSDPQFGTAGAGIQVDFFFGRRDRPPGFFQDTGFMTAGADWLAGWADAILAFQAEKLFDHAILQRMEADDCQPTTRTESLYCHGEHPLQRLQLAVHGDAQSLEGLCGWMMGAMPADGLLDNTG